MRTVDPASAFPLPQMIHEHVVGDAVEDRLRGFVGEPLRIDRGAGRRLPDAGVSERVTHLNQNLLSLPVLFQVRFGYLVDTVELVDQLLMLIFMDALLRDFVDRPSFAATQRTAGMSVSSSRMRSPAAAAHSLLLTGPRYLERVSFIIASTSVSFLTALRNSWRSHQ